jgi:signal transduction histidine kinase
VSARRSGLWAEIAVSLGLITLTAILLGAGVVWLVMRDADTERRTDLALTTARTLRAQLEMGESLDKVEVRRVLKPWKETGTGIVELWVVDRSLQPLLVLHGEPPSAPDAGLREALFGRREHVDLTGARLGERQLEVTEPLLQAGVVQGAVRVSLALSAGGPVSGRFGFLLLFTLVCGSVVAAFGAALFRRTLIRPIQGLQSATHRIAGGEFGHTAVVDAARELQDLATSLNTMSLSLEQYRSRTAEQVERLETANERLQRVQDELVRSEKLASVGRLAAGLAHEVGNPLAAVIGYTELLAQGLEDQEVERDLLARSQRELERIRGILGDLLDYARPGTGETVDVNVRLLLEEAVRRVGVSPGTRDVAVTVEVRGDLPAVRVEPDKIQQVLLNLLLNAGAAMGGRGSIRLGAQLVQDEVIIWCEDDGPGFDPADLPHVFDPFFTTKEPGEGTGLGLAISLRIVEEQGGWIRAENTESGGACVQFGLPVTRS